MIRWQNFHTNKSSGSPDMSRTYICSRLCNERCEGVHRASSLSARLAPCNNTSDRLRRGRAPYPAAECSEVALASLETTIHQIPPLAFRNAERERCNQPSSGEIVVDIGVDTHRHAETIDRGLQRLAVVLELRAARDDSRNTGGLEP